MPPAIQELAASIVHNPARVEVDPDFDNAIYMRVIPEKREPDKRLIAVALKEGGALAGARMVDGDRRVVIK